MTETSLHFHTVLTVAQTETQKMASRLMFAPMVVVIVMAIFVHQDKPVSGLVPLLVGASVVQALVAILNIILARTVVASRKHLDSTGVKV